MYNDAQRWDSSFHEQRVLYGSAGACMQLSEVEWIMRTLEQVKRAFQQRVHILLLACVVIAVKASAHAQHERHYPFTATAEVEAV